MRKLVVAALAFATLAACTGEDTYLVRQTSWDLMQRSSPEIVQAGIVRAVRPDGTPVLVRVNRLDLSTAQPEGAWMRVDAHYTRGGVLAACIVTGVLVGIWSMAWLATPSHDEYGEPMNNGAGAVYGTLDVLSALPCVISAAVSHSGHPAEVKNGPWLIDVPK